VRLRQTVHEWLRKYANEGFSALVDKASKPETCPHQMPAVVEARVLEMRRAHPDWGPRTILYFLAAEGVESVPGRLQSQCGRTACPSGDSNRGESSRSEERGTCERTGGTQTCWDYIDHRSGFSHAELPGFRGARKKPVWLGQSDRASDNDACWVSHCCERCYGAGNRMSRRINYRGGAFVSASSEREHLLSRSR
jgi:hypothetical protein